MKVYILAKNLSNMLSVPQDFFSSRLAYIGYVSQAARLVSTMQCHQGHAPWKNNAIFPFLQKLEFEFISTALQRLVRSWFPR